MKKFFSIANFGFALALLSLGITVKAQSGNTCAQAIPLTVNVNNCILSTVTTVGATASGISPTNCPGYVGGDLWIAVVMPPSGQLTFRAQLNLTTPNFIMDINMAVYSGVCGSLVQIGCDTDSGPGFYPELTFSGTPGVTYFIQLWDIGNNQQDQIDVCANGTPQCTSPTVVTTGQCGATNQYSVNVNITNLGSATTLNILNNGGAPAINNVTTTGVYSVGPFSLGQAVTVTVQNPADQTCNVVRNLSDVGLGCNRVVTCGSDLNQTYCYRNNDNTVFLYSSSNGSPITLTFITGLIQSGGGADNITIRNGTTATSPILFSGSNGGNLAGLTRTASSGSIRLSVASNAGGSCFDNSLGLGGGWNWTVACEGLSACEEAATVISQPTLAQSAVTASFADFSFSGQAQCTGPGSRPDPFFRFIAVGSVTYFSAMGAGDLNAAIEVFDACNGTQLFCSNTAGAGAEETFWLTDLIPGNEYVYRVFHAGASAAVQTVFTTGVYHIPFIELRNDFCGSTGLTSNSIIRSTTPMPATNLQGYVFEFTETQGPFTTYEVVSPNGTNPQFRMYWFTDFEYGRTYNVRTKAIMYDGPNMGDFGPACTISMASEPVSGLQPQFVGGTYDLCAVLRAISFQGTTNYRWTFDSGSEVLEYNSNSSSYFCSLQNVVGLQYGTSYTVRVFATGGNIESQISTESVINMLPTAPSTSLNPAFIACGSTVTLTAGTQAFNVCKASAYEFRFTNVLNPLDVITATRSTRAITFNSVPGLATGNTYNVAVRATAGGSTGAYGSECAISFAAPMPGIAPQVIDGDLFELAPLTPSASIYPNPNAGNEVTVAISNLSSSQHQIQIEVYDLTGKQIAKEVWGNSSTHYRGSIAFNQSLASGIYLLTTRVDGLVISTEKLFVK